MLFWLICPLHAPMGDKCGGFLYALLQKPWIVVTNRNPFACDNIGIV